MLRRLAGDPDSSVQKRVSDVSRSHGSDFKSILTDHLSIDGVVHKADRTVPSNIDDNEVKALCLAEAPVASRHAPEKAMAGCDDATGQCGAGCWPYQSHRFSYEAFGRR